MKYGSSVISWNGRSRPELFIATLQLRAQPRAGREPPLLGGYLKVAPGGGLKVAPGGGLNFAPGGDLKLAPGGGAFGGRNWTPVSASA